MTEGDVRPRRPDDIPRILELCQRVFDDRKAPGRTVEHLNWAYRDAPLGSYASVLEAASGELIAHYAGIPLRANADGEDVVVIHGVDSMVDPSARRGLRRTGPFLRVAHHFFRTWADRDDVCFCSYGFPNRVALRIGTSMLGYQVVADRFPTLFYNLFENRSLPLLSRVGDRVAMRRVERIGDEADVLWAEVRGHYPFALVRDSTFLNWRYARCPHPHELYRLEAGGRLRGIAVFRRDWCGAPIYALVDYVGDPNDTATLAAALRHGVASLRDPALTRFELWFPRDSQLFASALRLGLRQEPSLATLVCRVEHARLRLDWLRRSWFYTIGDTDWC